jgi:ABC-2 type transport system permease protein
MTTSTTTVAPPRGTRQGSPATPAAAAPEAHAPIPFRTVVGVELRKMFDTRSGFWMLVGILVLATLATAAVLLFAPDSMQNYGSYASAIGIPMAVILPMIAVLSVTSEWSQRSGLTTFTLVPHRGRVIGAKLVCTIGLGVVSMVTAMAVGAVGNVLGSQLAGVETVWGVTAPELGKIVLAGVLGMLMGFTLGVLFRSSAAAIVGYFVYSLVLPTLSGMLAAFQQWYADAQPWVDFQFTSTKLYDVDMTGTEWLQLAVTGTAWLVVPLAFGLWRVVRSEVK